MVKENGALDLDFEGVEIDAGGGDDIILITNGAEQHLYKTVDGGGDNDIIAIRGGVGGEVFGGSGDDTIYVNTRGAKVYGGEGADHFFWAPDILIADGGANDRASLFGLSLTGGIAVAGVGNDPQWIHQSLFPFIRYGLNSAGELVIEWNGQQMYVANYHGGPNVASPTLGIYTAVLTYEEDPDNRGLGSLRSRLDGYVTEVIQWQKSLGVLSPQDPLVLDLDGDGLELTPTLPSSGKFDFDDDWFKEQTGWVRPDDGFLVLDANGDGRITSVAEMFGSPAERGFLELATLDTNSDGKIDSADTSFAQLQIWQDLNQNRVTDAGELKSLTQLGIQSIGVNATNINVHTDAGHDLVAQASYTRTDGSTGTVYEALFNANQVQTEYRGDKAIADWAATLPSLHGYGLLADLGVVASNDFAVADAIAAKLNAFTVPDLDQLRTDAKPIIEAWVNSHPASRELTAVKIRTDSEGVTRLDHAVYAEDANGGFWQLASGSPVLDAQGATIARPQLADILAQTMASGDIWRLEQVWSPSITASSVRIEAPYRVSVDAAGTVTVLDYGILEHDSQGDYWRLASNTPVLDASGNVITRPTVADLMHQAAPVGQEWRIETFAEVGGSTAGPLTMPDFAVVINGTNLVDYSVYIASEGYWAWASALTSGIPPYTSGAPQSLSDLVIAYNAGQHPQGNGAEILGGQTLRLATVTSGVDLTEIPSFVASGSSYGFSVSQQVAHLEDLVGQYNYLTQAVAVRLAAQTGLKEFFAEVPYDPATDTFRPTSDAKLIPLYAAILEAAPTTNAAAALNYLEQWHPILDVVFGDFEYKGRGLPTVSEIFANVVAAYEDVGSPAGILDVAGKLGVDPSLVLSDTTNGATVTGDTNNNIFYLSTGDQHFVGSSGEDAYVVGRNFGHDVIEDVEGPLGGHKPDILRFANIRSDEIYATRDSQDLILTVTATGDELRIIRQFEGPIPSLFGGDYSDDTGVGDIYFADGVRWDQVDMAWAVSHPLASDDILEGTTDYDVLDGGAGTDVLRGGGESDIYVFGLGYGHDQIEDEMENALIVDNDMVLFGEGITWDDLTWTRDGQSDDLVITINGTGDQLTLIDQFRAIQTGLFDVQWLKRVELFAFSDNDFLNWEQVLKQVLIDERTAGNDQIYGFFYSDRLDGGAGNDFLSGGDESDTYVFGRGYGHDEIKDQQTNILTDSDDTLEFTADVHAEDIYFSKILGTNDIEVHIVGSDDVLTILGQYDVLATGVFGNYYFDRIERFVFTDGSEIVWTHDEVRARVLASAKTSGDDVIEGFSYRDTLDGGGGNDDLRGGSYNDTYVFARGYGHDTIHEFTENILLEDTDRVVFNDLTLADLTVSRDGNALIFTINETGETLAIAQQNERWAVGGTVYAVEEFAFADGQILTKDTFAPGVVPIVGTSGNDTLHGSDFGETFDGGAGNDRLEGSSEGDTYLFGIGSGNDTIFDRLTDVRFDGPDRILFGTGIGTGDIYLDTDGRDLTVTLRNNSDSITILGQYAENYQEIEELHFADGTVWSFEDTIERLTTGTSGDDHLSGLNGDDTLDGKGGVDQLRGNYGSDTYVYRLGDGDDTIEENGFTWDIDVLLFTNLNLADVSFTHSTTAGNDLVITVVGTGETITVRNHFVSIAKGLERFSFADGTILDLTTGQINAPYVGTESNDTITGTDSDETFFGHGGDDTVNAGGGHDTLTGGLGADLLKGGNGDDTYVYSLGDGSDTIEESGSGSDTDVLLLADLNPSDVTVARDPNNDLLIWFAASSDVIRVKGHFTESSTGLDEIRFADGTIWTRATLAASAPFYGTSAADTINGSTGNDTIIGNGGADLLKGGDGNDTYIYKAGDGNDTIEEYGWGYETNILQLTDINSSGVTLSRPLGSTGDLLIAITSTGETITVLNHFNTGATGLEQIKFADGTIWDRNTIVNNAGIHGTENADTITGDTDNNTIDGAGGNDTIIGDAGNDKLTGGTGADLLKGGDGNDTYIYKAGDGSDTIDEYGWGYETDILHLADINSPGVSLARSITNNDLFVTIKATGEVITVVNHFYSGSTGLEQIKFADGTIWDRNTIATNAPFYGTSGADTINGTTSADTIVGNGGVDLLKGGDGNDIYIYKAGDGSDTIDDYGWGYETDTLQLTDVNPSGVTLARSIANNDLFITIVASGDVITVLNHFTGSSTGLEQIRFADATIWDRNAIANYAVYCGTAAAETITGSTGANTIVGNGGADILKGGDGSDTYIYKAGDGSDTIEDIGNATNVDVLNLTDINPSTVSVSRSPVNSANLLIAIGSTGEVITVVNHFSGGATGLEQIKFADGSVWSAGDIFEMIVTIAGTTGNDTITGNSTSDVISGGGGNDTINGKAGNDVYIYARGDGSDTITEETSSGSADKLILKGINPTDISFIRNGIDVTLVIAESAPGAGDGGSILLKSQLDSYFDRGIDQIKFTNGTIWTASDLRANVLIAAQTAGNDTITGFNTNDTFYWARGKGNDTIIETTNQGTADKLVLQGVNPSEISFIRNGIDLTLVIAESAPGAGDGGSVLLKNQLDSYYDQGIEQIAFANGAVWTASDLRVNVLAAAQTSGNDTITGFNTNDTITGGAGNDIINGKEGNDTYNWARGDGNDTITEDVNGGSLDKLVLTGINPSDVTFVRSGIDVTLVIAESAPGAGDGASILLKSQLDSYFDRGVDQIIFANGTVWTASDLRVNVLAAAQTSGNNTITGFNTNDTFYWARGNGNDTIIEPSNQGTADKLVLTGINPSDITFVRNGIDVTLVVAESAPGAADGGSVLLKDQLDSYFDRGVEQIIFANGTVWTASDLRVNVLAAAQTPGNDTIVGFNTNDTINGGAGDDTLNGGTGNDTLIGGTGNDTYVVDSTSDVATEQPGEGTDTIQSSVTITALAANVENLTLTGSSAINGTGNGLDNVMTGNGNSNTLNGGVGNDTLNGGAGNDTLVGGTGNDTYVVDSASDVVTEQTAEGTDTIQSSVTITALAANVENLTLTGTSAINGTGNGLDNIIMGNSGNNTLNGSTGTDTVSYANATAAVTVSLAVATAQATGGAGSDTLSNFENLTGSAYNDTLTGSSVANVLNGGAGNDALTGGSGDDTFIFSPGFGNDTISDFTAGSGLADVIELSFGSSFDSLAEILAVTQQSGANAIIAFDVSTSLTLQNVQMTSLVADDFRFV